MTIEITEQVLIGGEVREVGAKVDVEPSLARQLIYQKCAKASEPVQVKDTVISTANLGTTDEEPAPAKKSGK